MIRPVRACESDLNFGLDERHTLEREELELSRKNTQVFASPPISYLRLPQAPRVPSRSLEDLGRER